ncbi:ROK family transcriptional regulator [Oceanomicrobium pacificus]|uniref:ROK family transcriptional regulator n=1 Tax=Oceanomicrobium pacificus TaxID=2692916 RepID=UPI0019675B74|nr:ROK family transcriptional regulator [Oceanomicrobium pacificus]
MSDELNDDAEKKVPNLQGGSNQARVRDHNERLVLTLIRRHGALSRAEIARQTGLSAQTVTVIIRALEADGFLLRGTPVKGRVGQPSIPMRLDPDAAHSFGLKVGRRSAELVLMNFCGDVIDHLRQPYKFPRTGDILDFAQTGIRKLTGRIPKARRDRIAGVGIAIPYELWNWGLQVGADATEMDAWRRFDIAAEIGAAAGLPAQVQNDATSACVAEHALGRGSEVDNFFYVFVGFFVGGGVVLNNSVLDGPGGNAGALGALPVPARSGAGAEPLIDAASILGLEQRLRAEGRDPSVLWDGSDNWSDLGSVVDDWIAEVAESLATAAVAICAVVDFGTIVIDGGFPDDIREKLAVATSAASERRDRQGLSPVRFVTGSIGPSAPAMGGAILPIVARHFISQTAIYH